MTRRFDAIYRSVLWSSSDWFPRPVCVCFKIEADTTILHLLFGGNLICYLTSVILESGWTIFYIWHFGLVLTFSFCILFVTIRRVVFCIDQSMYA
jgi:hypothetical protein